MRACMHAWIHLSGRPAILGARPGRPAPAYARDRMSSRGRRTMHAMYGRSDPHCTCTYRPTGPPCIGACRRSALHVGYVGTGTTTSRSFNLIYSHAMYAWMMMAVGDRSNRPSPRGTTAGCDDAHAHTHIYDPSTTTIDRYRYPSMHGPWTTTRLRHLMNISDKSVLWY